MSGLRRIATVCLLLVAAGAWAGPSRIITSITQVLNFGARPSVSRNDRKLTVDAPTTSGDFANSPYRDVYILNLDSTTGAVTTPGLCLTCPYHASAMPFNNGGGQYEPTYGLGMMFQAQNRLSTQGTGSTGPGQGVDHDFWFYSTRAAAANLAAGSAVYPTVYLVSIDLPGYSYQGQFYARHHGYWGKGSDAFCFSNRYYQRPSDPLADWNIACAEINWVKSDLATACSAAELKDGSTICIPKKWTSDKMHYYEPGCQLRASPCYGFYQMTDMAPYDAGLLAFETDTLYAGQHPYTTNGDWDTVTMRVRAADGTWLTDAQAAATVVVISNRATSKTVATLSSSVTLTANDVAWNELATFSEDERTITWMSDYRAYPPGVTAARDRIPKVDTDLPNIYTELWECSLPDCYDKRQLTWYNDAGSTEYRGGRTIASMFVWLAADRMFQYVNTNGVDATNWITTSRGIETRGRITRSGRIRVK